MAVLIGFSAAGAKADPKFMSVEWYGDHWTNQDFIPYYEDGMLPQNTQWDSSSWTPRKWIGDDGVANVDFINHLQRVGVIQGNGTEHGAPYLNVGPNFYHLSGFDKRRVIASVDAVYHVTDNQPSMFYLRDPRTKKMIGYYNKDGLFLE